MNAMLHNTTTLDLSMSELSALVLRATKGSGFSWGEADEAADACVWLAQMGAECVGPLLDVLLDKTSCSPDINVAVWEGKSVICPLRAGIILRDFVNLPNEQSCFSTPKTTSPHTAGNVLIAPSSKL